MPEPVSIWPPEVWPLEIRVAPDRRAIEVDFATGESSPVETRRLEAEYLRVESPSAEVQGHSPDQKQLVSGKRDVTIAAMDPVGNYAVKIGFSDGHATGLFTWAILYRMAREYEAVWPAYLEKLKQAGKSR
jgi:DUF971 family protein